MSSVKNSYDVTLKLPLTDISGSILNLMIPARDGVKLQTAVYFPPDFKGKAGVLLIRCPYIPKTFIQLPDADCLKQKAIFLVQSCRGTGWSEGVFDPADREMERKDGEDLLKWLEKQPWFNGRCAAFGSSYSGWTQWALMRTGSPLLVGTAPRVMPLWGCIGGGEIGGGLRFSFLVHWLFRLHHERTYGYTIPDYLGMNLTEHLPVLSTDEKAGYGKLDVFRAFLRNGIPPAKTISAHRNDGRSIRTPAFISGGWFDMFKAETFESFRLMKKNAASGNARKFTRLRIGPWGHGGLINPEIFGEECGIAKTEKLSRKFLFGLLRDPARDPIPGEPTVGYYMLGENKWHGSETWPPAGVRTVPFYLHSSRGANGISGDGSLSRRKPENETPDVYLSDPARPVPNDPGKNKDLGCYDRTPVQSRSDVLVFTSEPFRTPLAVTGEVTLKFTAEISTPDTDLFAVLTDVTPDGKAMMLTQGMIRARFRNSPEREELLVPGKKYDFELSLSHIAVKFLKGHRMRLDICGQSFPRFARNANTGNDPLTDTELKISRHTVFHDAKHPAVLRLPVLQTENND